MKRTLVILSVVALAFAVSALPAGSPVTIEARPRVLPSSLSPGAQPLELFGSLANGRSGEQLRIQANECTLPGWHDVVTADTEAGGTWHTVAVAESKTTFRARWKRAVSQGVTVQTRPAVALEQLGRTLWQVGVPRFFSGRRGSFQRFDAPRRRWRTIKTYRFTARRAEYGRTFARFTVVVPRGTQVRAAVPRSSGKPCFLGGYSFIFTKR